MAAAARRARSRRARAHGADGARSGRFPRGRARAVLAASGGRVCRPRARRMRWTSTPITPEPSPRRPKAAIASWARSRICAVVAVGDRLADRIAQRLEVEASVPSCRSGSARRCRAQAPRPRPRGRSSGRIPARRCAGPPATSQRWRNRFAKVLARRPGHASSAANASSISEVPTATPSLRSDSQKPTSRAAMPSGRSLIQPPRPRPRAACPTSSPRPSRRRGRCRCGA